MLHCFVQRMHASRFKIRYISIYQSESIINSSFSENLKIYGGEIKIQEPLNVSQLDFQCEIEANGTEIRKFEKHVFLSSVFLKRNFPQPQEEQDLQFSVDDLANNELSLSLYNLEIQSWTDNFEVTYEETFRQVSNKIIISVPNKM